MKSQVELHTVWCKISGDVAGEIWITLGSERVNILFVSTGSLKNQNTANLGLLPMEVIANSFVVTVCPFRNEWFILLWWKRKLKNKKNNSLEMTHVQKVLHFSPFQREDQFICGYEECIGSVKSDEDILLRSCWVENVEIQCNSHCVCPQLRKIHKNTIHCPLEELSTQCHTRQHQCWQY